MSSSYNEWFDILYGEGQYESNIGKFIHEYGGGVTAVDGRANTTWSHSYTTGMEGRGQTLSTSTIGSKTITVTFIIFGDAFTFSRFRRDLFGLLNKPKGLHKLRFNDEPNVYYDAVVSGSLSLQEDIEKLEAKGTITFAVPDGLAKSKVTKKLHSKSPKEIGSIKFDNTNNIATIVVNNEGTEKTHPKLRIEFNDNNGYVGIATKDTVLAVGNENSSPSGYTVDNGGQTSYVLVDKRYQPSRLVVTNENEMESYEEYDEDDDVIRVIPAEPESMSFDNITDEKLASIAGATTDPLLVKKKRNILEANIPRRVFPSKSTIINPFQIWDVGGSGSWWHISNKIKYSEHPLRSDISVRGGTLSYRTNNAGYRSKGIQWDKNGPIPKGYKYHGSAIKHKLKPDPAGESGAKNFLCEFNAKVWANALGQTGFLSVCLVDEKDDAICGYHIVKDNTVNDEIRVEFYGGRNKKLGNPILFGTNNNTPGYKHKLPNVAFNSKKGGAYIRKEGKVLTFGYNGTPYKFIVDAVEQKKCHSIIIVMGNPHYSPKGYMAKLVLESLRFTKTNATRFDLIANKYKDNTAIIVDNTRGIVRYIPDIFASIDGHWAQYQLIKGSEFFSIPPGTSEIKIEFSDFMVKPPDISIEWQEMFG